MKSKASTGKSPLKNVLIPLDGGLDTYSNPKNLDIDKLSVAENALPESGQLVSVPAPVNQPGTFDAQSVQQLGVLTNGTSAGDLLFGQVTANPGASTNNPPGIQNIEALNTVVDIAGDVKIEDYLSDWIFAGVDSIVHPPMVSAPTLNDDRVYVAYTTGSLSTEFRVDLFSKTTNTRLANVINVFSSAADRIQVAHTSGGNGAGLAGRLNGTNLILYDLFTGNTPISTIANVTSFDMCVVQDSVLLVYTTVGATAAYRRYSNVGVLSAETVIFGSACAAPISCFSFAPLVLPASQTVAAFVVNATTTLNGLRYTAFDGSFTFTTSTFVVGGITAQAVGNIQQLAAGGEVLDSNPLLSRGIVDVCVTRTTGITVGSTGHTINYPHITRIVVNLSDAAGALILPSLVTSNINTEVGGLRPLCRPASLATLVGNATAPAIPGTTSATLTTWRTLTTFSTGGATSQTNSPVGFFVTDNVTTQRVLGSYLRDELGAEGPLNSNVSQWGIFQAKAGYRFTIGVPVTRLRNTRKVSTAVATLGQQTQPQSTVSMVFVQTVNDSASSPGFLQIGEVATVASLSPKFYDGLTLSEIGFYQQPANLLTAPLTSGGSMASGLYYYVAIMRYTDGKGQNHFSDVSKPYPAVVPGSDTNNSVEVTLFYRRLQTRPSAILELYRTTVDPGNELGQLAYFKVAERFIDLGTTSPTNLATFAVTVTDTLADPTALSGEILGNPLYTNPSGANFVQPVSPPSFVSTAIWQQRLWGLAYNSGYQLWFSYPPAGGLTPLAAAFNADNVIDVPIEAGDVRQILALDDQLYIFGSKADYAITGRGPDRTTSGTSGYNIIGPYPSPGGMLSQNSGVRLPQGIMYQTNQGFVTLTRAGQYEFTGQPVRNLTSTRLFGRGFLIPTINSVIFPEILTTPGATDRNGIAFNYVEKKWFTLLTGVDANTRRGLTTGVLYTTPGAAAPVTVTPNRSTGAYYIWSPTAADRMVMETGWIQPGGITGYGEITDMQVLGDWLGPHILQVEEARDYGPYDAPRQQLVLTNTPDYQFRFGPVQTQVRAIRYRITIIPTNSSGIETFGNPTVRIFGIMLNVGIDPELSRLANSRNA